MVKKILQSPSVQAAVIYGVGGVGFAIGNILLAKALSSKQFALVALVLAIGQLTYSIGPLGANSLVIRYPVNASTPFLWRILASSAVVAATSSLVAWIIYDLSIEIMLITTVLCTAASVNIVGASIFRSRGRFLSSMTFTQSHNIVIVGAALLVIAAAADSAYIPLLIITSAYVVSASIAWIRARSLAPLGNAVNFRDLPWREGRTILITGIAVNSLIQLERLTIPKLLDYETLALFAVLASVAGSPYRVLQMGINFTLLPRLRQADDVAARRQIAGSEAAIAGAIVFIATVVVWLITQPFIHWFFMDRYLVGDALVGAAILAGIAKVSSSFACTGVTALGDQKDLSRLNIFSWLAVGFGACGAAVGASYGLAGVVLGVAAGWTFLTVAALYVSLPYFAEPKN
jgi:O-antigen/teichoic acid export membrane protein